MQFSSVCVQVAHPSCFSFSTSGTVIPKMKMFLSPTSSFISTFAPSRVPIVRAPLAYTAVDTHTHTTLLMSHLTTQLLVSYHEFHIPSTRCLSPSHRDLRQKNAVIQTYIGTLGRDILSGYMFTLHQEEMYAHLFGEISSWYHCNTEGKVNYGMNLE